MDFMIWLVMFLNGLQMLLMSQHFSYSHDMNMDYRFYNADEGDSEVLKRKVNKRRFLERYCVFYTNKYTRLLNIKIQLKCYIGFRCVVDFLR